MKRLLLSLILIGACTVMIATCEQFEKETTEPNTVHMGDLDFEQSSITLHKGSSITLVNDTSVAHSIQNGLWVNGTAKPVEETGAPIVNLQFTGTGSQNIGPFNTVGTFHFYCPIHAEMNLIITIQ